MKKTFALDLDSGEFHNVVRSAEGRLVVRDKLRVISEDDYIFAFSVVAATTSEVWHYVFTRGNIPAPNTIYLSLYNDNFILQALVAVGTIVDPKAGISYAVNYNQVVVNSPGWSQPLWGFIGSTLIPAVKTESDQPDTPAISLFSGMVCSFADRTVWAYRNQIYINEPDTDPRCITSSFALGTSGVVTDMFQSGDGGDLIIVTTDGLFIIPPDGLSGAVLSGQVSRSSGYKSLNYRNVATSRGYTMALTRDGVMDVRSGTITPLTFYQRNRFITKPVGPGSAGDYRTGQIWATDTGFAISTIGGDMCLLDMDANPATITWIYDESPIILVGVGRTRDGRIIYWDSDTVYVLYGTDDSIVGGIACENIAAGSDSNLIREMTVTVVGDGTRFAQSYVKKSFKSTLVPGVSAPATYTTVSLWGDDTTPLVELEPRSRRQQRGGPSQGRQDGIWSEVGATGSGTRFLNAEMIAVQVGSRRPSN